jgi:hypothetical protein
MVDIIGFFDTLLNASIAGIPFEIIDTREAFGRRVQQFLFPGIDPPVFQDLGVLDGPITITGILVGDDYIEQAANLRFALRVPGPLTLVHPWLGNVPVVLQGPNAATISFSHKEQRIAHFSVTVLYYVPPAPNLADTLSLLKSAVEDLVDDAEAMIASVLAPISFALAVFSYAGTWLNALSAGFSALVGGGGSGAEIGPACAAPIAALTVPATTPNAAWAASVAAAVAAVPAAIVGAAQPVQPSAVAPGGISVLGAAADAADATEMLINAVPLAIANVALPSPAPALACALQAIVIANAVLASSLIAYDSVQAAQAQAQVLFGLLDAAIAAAATQSQTRPQLAAPVWDDLISLKSALAADLNALVGRLPSVVTINTRTTLPAWLIAHYVAGDQPVAMASAYADILARNAVANPGAVAAGALEILQVQAA